MQMVVALAKVGTPANGTDQLEVLSSLAREIMLVASAAQAGCRAHVVGRAHLKCAPGLRARPSSCPAKLQCPTILSSAVQ